MNDPRISVVVPTYNSTTLLDRAIASLQTQSFTDFEVVVVDDGTDESEALRILERLPETTRLIRQANRGPAAARNHGVEQARGRYIFFIDSDDEISPEGLENLLLSLQEMPQAGYAFPSIELCGERSGRVAWQTNFFELLFSSRPATFMLIPRSLWQDLGGQDETMTKGLEDWEFAIRLASHDYFGVLSERASYQYHVSTSGHHKANALSHLGPTIGYIQRKHRDLYRPAGLFKLWGKWRRYPSRRPLVCYLPLWLALRILPNSMFSGLYSLLLRARWAIKSRFGSNSSA